MEFRRVLFRSRTALHDATLELPDALDEAATKQITGILKHLARRLEVKDAEKRETVPLRREVFLGDDFRELWDRIKHKTTYRVEFDHEALIESCAKALQPGSE